MLDLLELFGLDFDNMDTGGSCLLQQKLFPDSDPQSLCSYMVHRRWWFLVVLVGYFHCKRSYHRYN